MIIISPSKNLNLKTEDIPLEETIPYFSSEVKCLIKKIKTLDKKEIKSLMNISDSLAKLNFERYKDINKKNNMMKQAGFIFSGDTFNGLLIRSMNNRSLVYAEKNLRILSGLYGILKPSDLIEPYRLEMGTKMNNILGEDLYNYWGKKVTTKLNNDIKKTKSKYLFNLASNEYASVIKNSELESQIVNFDFKKKIGNNLSGIGMVIKKLRGAMARFIIVNKIQSIDKLEDFNEFGFKFLEFDNSSYRLVFVSQ